MSGCCPRPIVAIEHHEVRDEGFEITIRCQFPCEEHRAEILHVYRDDSKCLILAHVALSMLIEQHGVDPAAAYQNSDLSRVLDVRVVDAGVRDAHP